MKNLLRLFHPFLNEKFRTIYADELKSEELFKELFPNEEVQLWKLETIWKYQGKTKRLKEEPKTKKNGKV